VSVSRVFKDVLQRRGGDSGEGLLRSQPFTGNRFRARGDVEDRGVVRYPDSMNIVQSSLSLMGAFFVAVVTLGAATVAASWLMLGGVGPDYEPTSAYLAVNAVNSVFAALIGGYVVATVAESSPVGHAHVLGLIMAAVGVAALAYNGFEPAQGQSAWYALLVIAQAPVTSTLGGVRVKHRRVKHRRVKHRRVKHRVAKPVRRYSKRAVAADAARANSPDGKEGEHEES
jgi:hypothetical protein